MPVVKRIFTTGILATPLTCGFTIDLSELAENRFTTLKNVYGPHPEHASSRAPAAQSEKGGGAEAPPPDITRYDARNAEPG